MEEKIVNILEDIYRIDPSLKEREEEIMEMLTELLKNKPDLEPDNEFVAELRRELLEKTSQTRQEESKRFFPAISFKQLVFSFGGVALMVVIILGSKLLDQSSIPQNPIGGKLVASGVVISQLGDGAFGPLGGVTFPIPTEVGGGPSEILINYVPHYNFAGGDFSGLIADKAEILKKTRSIGTESTKDYVGTMFSLDLFDMKGLEDAAVVPDAKFCDNSESGYRFNAEAEWGFIYIESKDAYHDWDYNTAVAELDEKQAIAVADDFMKKYQVNLKPYSSPIVKSSDSVTIELLYPLQVNGMDVYQEYSDDLVGITVMIDPMGGNVRSVALEPQDYQASAYAIEKDTSKITEQVSKYIFWHNIDIENSQTVEMEVGDPKLCYRVRTEIMDDSIHYQNYLLPALAFKVKDVEKAKEIGAEKTVVVPIVKGFFEEKAER